jgi:serine/threonine protein kinase
VDRCTLLDHLRDSRLLSVSQLAVAAELIPEEEPTQEMMLRLVAEGLLTDYQAGRVASGQSQGLVLGQYHIIDELGRGGFGKVYKARHTVMDRVVAIKVIAPELVEDERICNWFQREVLTITKLYHPNIVMAYDAHQTEGSLFLVMEYVEGPNLAELVHRQGPLPAGLACEMMRQAGLALQYAHEMGLVHRDIKPGNLLIPHRESSLLPLFAAGVARPTAELVLVKVVDFGMARLQGGGKVNTLVLKNEQSFLGTPDYVAPEQARNVHAADIRSDLYSLGCTFYHALSGERPFKSATPVATIVKHLETEPEPLEVLRPELPPGLCAVVRRLMAKAPSRRFQTPAEMVAELEFLRASPEVPALGLAVPQAKVVRPRPARPGGSSGPLPVAHVASSTRVSPGQQPVGDNTQDKTLPAEQPSVPPVAQPVGTQTEMRQAWQRWVAVLEAVAGTRRHIHVDDGAYCLLHKTLLAMCRSRISADAAADDANRQLECLLEPWLTPAALLAADKSALAGLVERCRELELSLNLRRRGSSLAVALAALAAVAMAVVAGWQLSRAPTPALAHSPSAAALWNLLQTNPLLAATVAVPVVVLASIYGFTRWLRA